MKAFLTALFFCVSVMIFAQHKEAGGFLINDFIENVEINVPDVESWNLITDSGPKQGSKGLLMFKRKPILDSMNRQVEPVMAILYEQNPEAKDAIEYSVGLIGTKNFKLKWQLLGGFPEYSLDKHSVVFEGTYYRDSIEHSVLIAYILCNNVGVEIICDSTTEIYPQVEKEMSEFIKAFRINEKN